MAIRLNDLAPDFRAETTEGNIQFHDWLGDSWGVLFSHPADFTPVCTTELGAVARLRDEFHRRNVKVMALSADPLDSHRDWIGDINETQRTQVNFPIIADPKFEVANLYDMVHPQVSDKFTVRSVFIVGPDKKVKLTITYPASTGRNFDEILRVIDSLQLTARYGVATPANWQHGEDVIITAGVKDEEIPARFPKGHTRVKPYLRTTPQPDLN
jgi:thioredoxin-dependent peroxiredoxin